MREVLAIVGPTAVGKSALALALAEERGAEIVNTDALQVYRGFDIGTAKPTLEERARVRHHLIDVLDPEEPFSAGAFARRARRVLGELDSAGRGAVLVGGSGLYLRSLLEGLHEIPDVPPEVRAELARRLEAEGLENLRAELRRVDPSSEARLARGDTQRVLRALEVALGTGRPLSDWLSRRPAEGARIPARKIGLTLSRTLLYDRIRSRVESMLQAGWIREIDSLLNQGYSGEEPAFQAIGYRQLLRHQRGEVTLEEAVEETVRSTRRYAKRQLTWFRKDPEVAWFDALDREALHSEVRGWLR